MKRYRGIVNEEAGDCSNLRVVACGHWGHIEVTLRPDGQLRDHATVRIVPTEGEAVTLFDGVAMGYKQR